ncbi:MAG: TIM barrel protein [Anaerolineae bacterium]
MNPISFNCSNLVGKQAQYQADWEKSVLAVNQYYQPIDTFAERFDAMLTGIAALGFTKVDVWTAGQLNWAWATSDHISLAGDMLQKRGMQVTSLGGEFGATQVEFDNACRMAVGVGTSLLSGTLPLLFTDRNYVVNKLRDNNLKLAIENHPERDPTEMLDKIGSGEGGLIGTAIDTGWYSTQGYDAAQAIIDLKDHLLHVHLKDVLAGPDHVNCGYGKGVVDIARCVSTLKTLGFTGDISIEIHAVDHDPTDELREGLQMVEGWLRI